MRANSTTATKKPARSAYIAEYLRRDRERLGLSQSELSAVLQTPKRTLQDWESGARRVPGIAAVAMSLLISHDEKTMAGIKDSIASRIARDFPHGIPSEREPAEP